MLSCLIMLIPQVGKSAAALQPPEYNLEEMASYLSDHMPKAEYNPFGSGILRRDGKHDDYRDVSWHSLLAGNRNACPSLSIAKSEAAFFKRVDAKSLRISRRYDIDSFFGIINNLAVHAGGFSFAYNPQFLRRITQNPYLRFKGYLLETPQKDCMRLDTNSRRTTHGLSASDRLVEANRQWLNKNSNIAIIWLMDLERSVRSEICKI